MVFATHRNIFFTITGVLIALSIAALFVFPLQFGADFTGGVLVEATYEGSRPDARALEAALAASGIEGYSVRESGERGYVVRAGNLSEQERAALPSLLSEGGMHPMTISRFTEVGPTIGVELRNKAYIAIGLVMLCILLFIAFAFRKVSEPVSSWIYGVIALIALAHDVIIPVGAFSIFGYLWGAQVDTLFVTALLTILGFSVHDTIVVFDRVRENLRINQERNRHEDFAAVAGRSLDQTIVRSINTSVTVVISLLALYFLGPASTQDFALTLLVGIVAGTYSSIALATPLLVSWASWRKTK